MAYDILVFPYNWQENLIEKNEKQSKNIPHCRNSSKI